MECALSPDECVHTLAFPHCVLSLSLYIICDHIECVTADHIVLIECLCFVALSVRVTALSVSPIFHCSFHSLSLFEDGVFLCVLFVL